MTANTDNDLTGLYLLDFPCLHGDRPSQRSKHQQLPKLKEKQCYQMTM